MNTHVGSIPRIMCLVVIALLLHADVFSAPVPRPSNKRGPFVTPAEASNRQCCFAVLGPKLRESSELIMHTSDTPDYKIFFPKEGLENIEDRFLNAKLTGAQFDALCKILGECTDDLKGEMPEEALLQISVSWEVKGKPSRLVVHHY